MIDLRKTPSTNLRRYGQYQLGLSFLLGVAGAIYCAAAALKSGPIMDPAIYGDLVTSVPAEAWSWPITLASCVYLLGIWINGNWRWSPFLRLAGALVHAVSLTLFAIMAYRLPTVDPFVVTAALCGAANIWFFALNLGDAVRAIRGVKDAGHK